MPTLPETSDETTPASRVTLLVLVSVLAGLLVAGMAFPLIGGLGLAAKASSEAFEDLPAELRTPPLPQRSKILAADGTELATIFLNEDRVVVPLEKIPAVMRQAIVAIEDSRFYEHNGVDLKGLGRALVENSQSGSALEGQGASTITQQYVKNVLIEQADTDQERAEAKADTVARKLREARYAIALEQELSKNEILQRYLNIAYFGDGVYGVGTAAQHYFNVPVEQLSLPQAALLAGLVRNPNGYDPTTHPEQAQHRRNVVLNRMVDVGFISAAESETAKATPLQLDVQPAQNGCTDSWAPFFCDYILNEAQDDPAFGETKAERNARLFQGGLTIRTTLDPKTQHAAQQAVDSTITEPRVATATVSMEPGTGQVKAMAENRVYGADPSKGQTRVNYATGRGGTGFQAGSTFKAFTIVAALEAGVPVNVTIPSPNPLPVPEGCDSPESGHFVNSDVQEAGIFDLRKATADSINTFFVQLEKRVGVLNVAKAAQELGVRGIDEAIKSKVISSRACSFTLGTLSVTPLEMATAYSTLAAHGMRCRPVAILEVTTASGDDLELPPAECEQVIPAGIADTTTDLLQGPIASGTATNAQIARPAAGKTGTTQGFSAAWFVGYVPQLTTAVWVGDPRGGTKYPLIGVAGGTGRTNHVYGGGLPAIIWHKLMADALEGVPVQGFGGVDPEVVNGQQSLVPDVTGASPADAVATLTQAGFSPTVAGGRVDDPTVAQGAASRTSPQAGSNAAPASVVTVYVSNGLAPSAPQAPPPSPAAQPAPVVVTASPSSRPSSLDTNSPGRQQRSPGRGAGAPGGPPTPPNRR